MWKLEILVLSRLDQLKFVYSKVEVSMLFGSGLRISFSKTVSLGGKLDLSKSHRRFKSDKIPFIIIIIVNVASSQNTISLRDSGIECN